MSELTIKFSHNYNKLQHIVTIDKAVLLQAVPFDLKYMSAQFRSYDTEGIFPLPADGKYIMLLFREIPFAGIFLFTTLRPYSPEKWKFYTENTGKIFNVVIKK